MRGFESFLGNVLPVFDITEQTDLVQAVYLKRISWGSLYVSYNLVDKLFSDWWRSSETANIHAIREKHGKNPIFLLNLNLKFPGKKKKKADQDSDGGNLSAETLNWLLNETSYTTEEVHRW